MKSIHTLALVLIALSFCLATGCAERSANTPMELSAFAGWKGAGPKGDDSFTFVVVGDRTGGHEEGKWADAIRRINSLSPDFVICVGDLIEGYTEDVNELETQWDEFDSLTKKLDLPFFYCPGNHDVSNDLMLEFYTKRHGVNGKSYYSFDYKGRHFVILDSGAAQKSEAFAQEQLAWLEKDIASAKQAKHFFVFYHHPSWDESNWVKARKLLPAGKTTIFNGHWHSLNYRHIDGVPSYVIGATAAMFREKEISFGNFPMLAQVTAWGDSARITILSRDHIFPGSYAKEVAAIKQLEGEDKSTKILSEGGGIYTFRKTNTLQKPIKLTVNWAGQDWKITPSKEVFPLKPGQTAEKDFKLLPTTKTPSYPMISLTYEFAPEAGEMDHKLIRNKRVTLQFNNLTTGKPVEASSFWKKTDRRPENAVNGIADSSSWWGAVPHKQWIKIDLMKTHTLDRVHVFPLVRPGRYYQYTVELSTDGEKWIQVADMSKNTKTPTLAGDLHHFKSQPARYIKVNTLYNSDNLGVHIAEIWAFEAE